MKQLLITLIVLMFTGSLLAQEFAPVGATWYYNEQFAFSGDINYIKFTVEKDTLFNGKTCRKITKRHKLDCNDRPDIEYMYSSNDTVFFYDPFVHEFQILYVFNAQVNDSWLIKIEGNSESIDTLKITVDSVKTRTINEIELNSLHVTYEWKYARYASEILEKVGDVRFMFNWETLYAMGCDANYTNGLRCYADDDLGLYSTGLAESCDEVYYWDEIKTIKEDFKASVFPNPAGNLVEVCFHNKQGELYEFELYNVQGKRVYSSKIKFTNHVLVDISDYQSGIYFYKLIDTTTNEFLTGKIIKQ